MAAATLNIAVLISGNGSNLQALIDHAAQGNYRIACVISNKANAYGLQRANQAGIANHVVDHNKYDSREAFDAALVKQLNHHQVDLVVLAGFMRMLTPTFIQAFSPSIINIHPSLLPKYPGLHTHQRALDAGDREHGVSVHIVTEELDAGPVLAQAQCTIEPNDTAESLQQKVHQLEHQLYPQVISDIVTANLPRALD